MLIWRPAKISYEAGYCYRTSSGIAGNLPPIHILYRRYVVISYHL